MAHGTQGKTQVVDLQSGWVGGIRVSGRPGPDLCDLDLCGASREWRGKGEQARGTGRKDCCRQSLSCTARATCTSRASQLQVDIQREPQSVSLVSHSDRLLRAKVGPSHLCDIATWKVTYILRRSKSLSTVQSHKLQNQNANYPPNLPGNKYNMRRPGIAGHLLFDMQLQNGKIKTNLYPPITLMSVTDNRHVKRDPVQAAVIGKDVFIKWKQLKGLCLKIQARLNNWW